MVSALISPHPAVAQFESPHLVEVVAVPERDASAKALHATEIAGLVGNALIVETDANYSRFDTDGSLNVSARQAIAEAVLTH
ncbi:MAG: hypothetical protein KDI56_13625, partial [Xanthomonadales bacterium]|nr:hypothetical protein [Xanthomonadales bacterium]